MDLKQLEVFAAVVSQGSFSKAAEQLFLTQPTVSAHIKKLEAELGQSLIQRNTKSLRVTAAGQRFYPYAQAMLNLRRQALAEMQPEGVALSLAIGASSIPSAYVLPELMAGYAQEHPGLSFNIVRQDSLGVLAGLLQGETDLGLVGTYIPDERCLYQPFLRDELVLATPNNAHFRKLRQQGADIYRLLQEPLIMRESSSGTRREAEHILEALGLAWSSLQVVATLNDPAAVKNSIASGMGAAILSRRAASGLAASGQALLFPFGGNLGQRWLYIVTRKLLPPNRTAQDFIAFIRRQTAAAPGQSWPSPAAPAQNDKPGP